MKSIRYVFLILTIIFHSSCQATTEVYDYELYPHTVYVADPTGFPNEFVLAPTVSQFCQQSDTRFEERLWGGVIGTLRLVREPWWIECITAYATERLRFKDTGIHGKLSRTGFDDFLIDCGGNFFLDEEGKVQLSLHFLTGIPLFKRVIREEVEQPLVGTRTFNIGPAVDFTYEFIRSEKVELFAAVIARVLHRFSRKYTPIFPPEARFSPGNVTDLVFLMHYRNGSHNVEAGYNPTFITNQSLDFPLFKQKIPSVNLSSFYALYTYYIQNPAMSVQAGFNYTFNRAIKQPTWFFLITWYF